MKEIKLVPELDACDFTYEINEELISNDVGIHYESNGIYINWNQKDDFPVLKNWLKETYGEKIKQYSSFLIIPT